MIPLLNLNVGEYLLTLVGSTDMYIQALEINDQFNKAYDLLDFDGMLAACNSMSKHSESTSLFLYNRMLKLKAD